MELLKYILFLRGINVGGKNKVSMEMLKTQLSKLGFKDIVTYINSGNILFSSTDSIKEINNKIKNTFNENYNFEIYYSLIPASEYKREFDKLPKWWFEPMARKDVLFFTEEVDKQMVIDSLNEMKLHNEKIHIGEIAVFWGKYDEGEFLKTAYHKYLIKQPYYKQITIRNEKTSNKMLSLITD